MGRIRLKGNYEDGKLRSVTFSKGQGAFSVPVSDGTNSPALDEHGRKPTPVRKSSLREFCTKDQPEKG